MKEQGNIASGPTDSNIIFTGNGKKPANLSQQDSQKVLYNVLNNKIECQTDSRFCYKSFKYCSHTVAIAVQLKRSYMSKVKRYSTNGFADNVVEISRNPNAGQKKAKSTQKMTRKANKKPEKVMKHVDPSSVYVSAVQQPN